MDSELTKNYTERLLYMALLLIFIGIGIALYALISFSHKIDSELQTLNQLSKDRAATNNQIKQAVDEIKGDDQKNTQYLVCIATSLADNRGVADLSGCQLVSLPASATPVQPATPSATTRPATPSPAPNTNSQQSTATPSTNKPAATPTPSSPPSFVQRLLNSVRHFL